MHRIERLEIILNSLEDNGFVSVKALAERTGMSLDSIRRDLRVLQRSGLLEIVHGGAILPQRIVTNRAYEERKKKNIAEKKEIAKKATELVEDGQTIALNAGTTNITLAESLIEKKNQLTILTNSIPITEITGQRKDYEVHIPGGQYDLTERSVYNKNIAIEDQTFASDIAFISVNALSYKEGVTDFRNGELHMISFFIHQAERVVLLADHSKFETVSNYFVCGYANVYAIITDHKLDKSIKKKYEKNGIKIL